MEEHQKVSKFSFWDKFWLTLATIIVLLVAVIRLTIIKTVNPKTFDYIGVFLPYFLMMFQYRALRKSRVFIAWTIVALAMFIEFFWLKSFYHFLPSKYNPANSFKGPICFLFLFAIFRKTANEYFYSELIIPRQYSNYSYKEQRYTNGMDVFAFFVFQIVIVLTWIY